VNKDISLKPEKILLVDDNPRVRSFVRPALEDAGFDCIEAEDGWSALDIIAEDHPDLIVLDIMLGDEDMSGLDVCKRIRRDGISTPVIFLTIKDRREDPRYLERAFQLGADDYVTKSEELRQLEQSMGLVPTEFLGQKSDVDELIARIKARLCLQEPELDFDDYLKVNPKNQMVKIKQAEQWEEVHLTPAEFIILNSLIKAAGRPVGKVKLMDIAGVDGEGSLQNHIWRLRSKIEKNPEFPTYVITYHRLGYRFKDQTLRSNS
jgi:two-component system, OmpR family, alkaline phosphatase synthesis response regulator PhoP